MFIRRHRQGTTPGPVDRDDDEKCFLRRSGLLKFVCIGAKKPQDVIDEVSKMFEELRTAILLC
jgi:hypothetical protein